MAKPAGSRIDPRRRVRVIRDPIYDYIELPLELNSLIETPLLQRLRRVSQTAMCSVVYPSMTGTRLEHALGTMYLSGRMWDCLWDNSESYHAQFQNEMLESIKRNSNELDECTSQWSADENAWTGEFSSQVRLVVQSAALLHDLGHPPFSHALEPIFERHADLILREADGAGRDSWRTIKSSHPDLPFHEVAGIHLLDFVPADSRLQIPWWCVKHVLCSGRDGKWADALHRIVSSEVDSDRMDYLVRDNYKAGTEFGTIDVERLIQSAELHVNSHGDWVVGFGRRATSALETFLQARLQYYRWVVFHSHTVGSNRMLRLAIHKIMTAGDIGPKLNYFAPSTTQGSILLASCVDDSMVCELLKRGLDLATPRAAGGDDQTELGALSMATLMQSPNWVSVWKTDSEYGRLADQLIELLIGSINKCKKRLVSERNAKARKGQSVAKEQPIIDIAQGWIRYMQDTTSEGVGRVIVLNEFCSTLFSAPGVRTRNELCESTLEREMTRISSEDQSLPVRGIWVVAFEKLNVVSHESERVQVFDYDDGTALHDVSPMVRGLRSVEDARGHFFPYFLATDGARMRADGRTSIYRDEIERSFLSAFPKAVELTFAQLVHAGPDRVDE